MTSHLLHLLFDRCLAFALKRTIFRIKNIYSCNNMRIPAILIGIVAIIAIAAIVWMVRNNKKETYMKARNGRCPSGTFARRQGSTLVCIHKKQSSNKQKTEKKNYGKKIATIQEEYPYWGWGVHAGLRCARPDNTGCNTGYDSKGRLRRLNQSAYD